MIVTSFFQALRAGKELANAETWKDAQQLANSLTALLVAGVALAAVLGHPIPLTPEQINSLVDGVLVVLGLFNWVATAVSSKRAGLLPRRRSTGVPGADDRSGHEQAAGREPVRGADNDAGSTLPDMSMRG